MYPPATIDDTMQALIPGAPRATVDATRQHSKASLTHTTATLPCAHVVNSEKTFPHRPVSGILHIWLPSPLTGCGADDLQECYLVNTVT